MRELYEEYFSVPKEGKIREKVMLTRAAVTVAVILFCLAAMSFSAFAYFSHGVVSGISVIKAARFEADVSVTATEESVEQPTVAVVDSKTVTAQLKAGVKYTFSITAGENSTAKTGFCVLSAENCAATYFTQQIGIDAALPDKQTNEITFTLTVSSDTTVTIYSHWGTSAYYDAFRKGRDDELYITSGEKIGMPILDAAAIVSEDVNWEIRQEDGALYYYIDGEQQIGCGVVALLDEEGKIFYIYVRSTNGQLATGKYWPSITNNLLVTGEYDWGEDGRYYPVNE